MASKKTWSKCHYFKPDSKIDNWGDPYAINDTTVLALDDFRRFIGLPVFVTRGTQGTRDNSMHSKKNGYKAVDVIVPDWDGSAIDFLFAAFRFPFAGLGFYPHWHWKGKRSYGLHLDTRTMPREKDFTLNYKQARWMGVNENGKQVYKALSLANLMKYCGGNDDNNNGNMGLS